MAARRRSLNQVGDTIIEVMICLAIIALVISGAYNSATRSLRVGQRAQERTEALKFAESQIEKIKYLSSNANSDVFDDPNQAFCLDGNDTKVFIADTNNYGAYGACAFNRYNISVVYSGDPTHLFTIHAVWDRLGGTTATFDEQYDQLKLFYRQPPDLTVSLLPTPTIFATPTPTPTPTVPNGPNGSTCTTPNQYIRLVYNQAIPIERTYSTGIIVPAGNFVVEEYSSRDHNYNGALPIQTEEQWHISVGGNQSADTVDVPDADDPSGFRSVTGSLPAFAQTGGEIILEHRNVDANPGSVAWDSVNPYYFCYRVDPPPGGPDPCEWSIVRSFNNSFLGNMAFATPGADPANAGNIINNLWQSPNATVFISGLSDTCAIANVFNVTIRTDGSWLWANPSAFPDSVEVALRRKSNPNVRLPVTNCPDNAYFNNNPPNYGSSGFDPFTGNPYSGLCYIRNLYGGGQVITWDISSANGNLSDLELLVYADGSVDSSGNARFPEIVWVENPIQ